MERVCAEWLETGSCGKHLSHADHDGVELGKIVMFRNLYKVESPLNLAALKNCISNLRRYAAQVPGKTTVKMTDGAIAVNRAPHLKGNAYLIFTTPQDAAAAAARLNGLILPGFDRKMYTFHTPMTNLKTGVCKFYKQGKGCSKGIQCKKMHLERLDKSAHQTNFGPRQKFQEIQYNIVEETQAVEGNETVEEAQAVEGNEAEDYYEDEDYAEDYNEDEDYESDAAEE